MMTDHERDRLRKLADKLKSSDTTGGNLEGVMAVAVLDCLSEIERLRAVCERIDFYGEALIQREYEPGSGTVRDLVRAARDVLSSTNA